jgi:hypothetical protein
MIRRCCGRSLKFRYVGYEPSSDVEPSIRSDELLETLVSEWLEVSRASRAVAAVRGMHIALLQSEIAELREALSFRQRPETK